MSNGPACGVLLKRVAKIYARRIEALHDVDLEVTPGEWLVLVGPSGWGKTTTLRISAGLEVATSGSVMIGGELVDRVPPWRRGVAMVFQRPALAPTRTVKANLNFGQPDGNEA